MSLKNLISHSCIIRICTILWGQRKKVMPVCKKQPGLSTVSSVHSVKAKIARTCSNSEYLTVFFFLMWEEIYENRKDAEKDCSFTFFHLENVGNQALTIKHVSLVYSVVHRQSKKLGTSSSLSIAGRRNGWDHCTSGLDSTLMKLKTSLTDWLMWKMSKVTITSNSFTMSARSESLPDTKQGKYNKK